MRDERVCCYIINGVPSYLDMTRTSIRMIRQHNRRIKVRVFFVQYASYRAPDDDFLAFSSRHDVEIVYRPSVEPGLYFMKNKVYLGECTEPMILLLDSDTFIFGDVERLFDRYGHLDVTACCNDWVWSRGYRKEFIPEIDVPLNGGVVLCTKAFADRWTSRMPIIHEQLETGKRYPQLSAWIKRRLNNYNRDELALSICTGEGGWKVGHFKDEDCRINRSNADKQTFQRSLIFHSFSHKWREYNNLLRGFRPTSSVPAEP